MGSRVSVSTTRPRKMVWPAKSPPKAQINNAIQMPRTQFALFIPEAVLRFSSLSEIMRLAGFGIHKFALAKLTASPQFVDAPF
jgi:hypothetical protein